MSHPVYATRVAGRRAERGMAGRGGGENGSAGDGNSDNSAAVFDDTETNNRPKQEEQSSDIMQQIISANSESPRLPI